MLLEYYIQTLILYVIYTRILHTNALLLTVVHIEDEFEIHAHFRMGIWFMPPTEAEKPVMLCYTEEQQNERENRPRASDKQYLFSFHLQHRGETYISSLPASWRQ